MLYPSRSLMAVPKQKQSHSRTSKRRAQHKISAPTYNACPTCHSPRLPHRVCPVCGSSVFDKRGSEIEVNAGALDSDNLVRPTYETWVCRRERWLPAFPVDHRYEHNRE